MIQAFSLGGVLFVVWLLLSGHYTALLLSFGVLSCALVVLISVRMGVVDREGHPTHLCRGALTYWPWLLLEIVKANIDVAKRIIDPALPISPTMVRVKASQKTELGRVIYANSITLTPGTISVELDGDMIEVHSLTAEGAESLQDGDMDRRVTAMECAA